MLRVLISCTILEECYTTSIKIKDAPPRPWAEALLCPSALTTEIFSLDKNNDNNDHDDLQDDHDD